jgi:sugar O-acyltransferase (sialic acid O-acetyltransferase NeuD family)
MKSIIILGTGGNCIDILDAINEINLSSPENLYTCAGFLDDDGTLHDKEFFGVKVLGTLDTALSFQDCFFVNGIGSPSNFWQKPEIIAKTNIPVDRFETIIHPSASISNMAKLGRGAVILQNATVASNVVVGNHVIILPNSIVSHDCIIGDFTSITGGVSVSGGARVGDCCYLGTNSAINNNVTIGKQSLIGMGSVVLKDVPENSVVAGNPARFLRNTVKE